MAAFQEHFEKLKWAEVSLDAERQHIIAFVTLKSR
jgi:hypothetical protein